MMDDLALNVLLKRLEDRAAEAAEAKRLRDELRQALGARNNINARYVEMQREYAQLEKKLDEWVDWGNAVVDLVCAKRKHVTLPDRPGPIEVDITF